MAGAGEGERDDQEQKVREFNRLKSCFSGRGRPRQTYGTTDRQHLMIWVENAAFIHQGSDEAVGEAEQMEETRATGKVGEPMNTPDRHEWKRQKEIQRVCS